MNKSSLFQAAILETLISTIVTYMWAFLSNNRHGWTSYVACAYTADVFYGH